MPAPEPPDAAPPSRPAKLPPAPQAEEAFDVAPAASSSRRLAVGASGARAWRSSPLSTAPATLASPPLCL